MLDVYIFIYCSFIYCLFFQKQSLRAILEEIYAKN